MFESLVIFFPTILLAAIGISIAILLPLIHSCRTVARESAGQSAPKNIDTK